VLVVWLMVQGGQIGEPIEIGTYLHESRCEAARDGIKPAEGVTFIARCIERDK
jgi:hypothetical protein